MGESDAIVPLLESLFQKWSFIGLDARSSSGGLAIGWSDRRIKLINS
jgi:hypothetical protein